MACDGFFHLQRRVFSHWQIVGDQGRQRSAPGLAQQQRGLRVHVDKHDFNDSRFGLVALYDFIDAVEQNLQTCRQIAQLHPFGACGADSAAGHVAQMLAIAFNYAKACGLQAGVNAKNSHE